MSLSFEWHINKAYKESLIKLQDKISCAHTSVASSAANLELEKPVIDRLVVTCTLQHHNSNAYWVKKLETVTYMMYEDLLTSFSCLRWEIHCHTPDSSSHYTSDMHTTCHSAFTYIAADLLATYSPNTVAVDRLYQNLNYLSKCKKSRQMIPQHWYTTWKSTLVVLLMLCRWSVLCPSASSLTNTQTV